MDLHQMLCTIDGELLFKRATRLPGLRRISMERGFIERGTNSADIVRVAYICFPLNDSSMDNSAAAVQAQEVFQGLL